MKKLILIFVLFFSFQQSYSYSWQSFGPEGINVTNLCLFEPPYEYQDLIICSDSGMFLIGNGWSPLSWDYFNYPAKDAVHLNFNTILFVAGDGSYSDGIYSLNLQTHEIEVVDYCINPAFIKYYEQAGVYYVGFENGLLKSENGSSWEAVPFFTGKNCIEMEFDYDHMIVNVSAAITHLYLSDDTGSTWTEASNCPGWFSSLAFYWGSNVHGVFPGYSNSSGLWYSGDYGNNWEIGFYSDNMKTICGVDSESFFFLGWENPADEYEGIALYYPDDPPPGLLFLNEGLPNTSINKIRYQPLMCTGAVIYACTDNGVYTCWDYFVGIDEHSNPPVSISVFPNPVLDRTTIQVKLTEPIINDKTIMIFNNQGKKVDEVEVNGSLYNQNTISWDKGNLPSGVYYLVIKTNKRSWSEKFIIL